MNIAILIPELGGGGAERVSQIVGDYYVKKGHNVYYFLADMVVRQVYPVKGKVIHTGIKSCTEDNNFGYIQIFAKLARSSFKMRKLKKKYKIDVAISFMEEFNYINILSKGREKVITRICVTLSQAEELTGILYDKYVVSFFYNRADRVIVLCDYVKDDMCRNYGVARKRMVKVPNPALSIDTCGSEKDWEYGDKVIVAVGRLEWQKQHERIIRAFSYVSAHDKVAKLLILGAGSNEAFLKRISRKYGLEDRIVFTGFRSNIAYYLKNSKVFVMASKYEGVPNSMLEAMACGLPVVTTNSPGGCGELVGKKKILEACSDIQYCPYGILTPHMSGKVQLDSGLEKKEILLGQAMLELLNNEQLHEKYSRRSLKRASMYNIERVMKKWDKLLFEPKI